MRTSSTAATAAPAAPPAAKKPITPQERRTVVLLKIYTLSSVAPVDWRNWEYDKLAQLLQDISTLSRTARSKASLSTVLRISARVAAAYGVDMATIDPCHGSAA